MDGWHWGLEKHLNVSWIGWLVGEGERLLLLLYVTRGSVRLFLIIDVGGSCFNACHHIIAEVFVDVRCVRCWPGKLAVCCRTAFAALVHQSLLTCFQGTHPEPKLRAKQRERESSKSSNITSMAGLYHKKAFIIDKR